MSGHLLNKYQPEASARVLVRALADASGWQGMGTGPDLQNGAPLAPLAPLPLPSIAKRCQALPMRRSETMRPLNPLRPLHCLALPSNTWPAAQPHETDSGRP